jgi:hypothetical protein
LQKIDQARAYNRRHIAFYDFAEKSLFLFGRVVIILGKKMVVVGYGVVATFEFFTLVRMIHKISLFY